MNINWGTNGGVWWNAIYEEKRKLNESKCNKKSENSNNGKQAAVNVMRQNEKGNFMQVPCCDVGRLSLTMNISDNV